MSRSTILVAVAALVVAGRGRAEEKQVVKLDPEAYAAEVKKDPKAAAAKYKGKVLELSGRVAGLHRNAGGEVFLSLPSRTAGVLGVACFLKDKDVFGKVVKGQEVTVRGRYPDYQFGAQVMDCEIVKKGASPALTYKAEDFAAEWAKDRKAAAEKWKDKPIIVSGVITAAKANDVGAITVYLKAGDKGRVDCGFTAFEKDLAGKLKAGDRVTVVGEFMEFESRDDGPALRFCLPVKE
jgi:hypothetical protein